MAVPSSLDTVEPDVFRVALGLAWEASSIEQRSVLEPGL